MKSRSQRGTLKRFQIFQIAPGKLESFIYYSKGL